MTVDQVKNSTTRDSAIYYTVTLRIWSQELEEKTFANELAIRVKKAIEGIS